MQGGPWSHPATEELLGLAVDLLAAGDRRALTLLADVLGRECGTDFAATVTSALAAGAPVDAFDFLPAPHPAAPRAAGPSTGAEAGPPPPAPLTSDAAPVALESAPVTLDAARDRSVEGIDRPDPNPAQPAPPTPDADPVAPDGAAGTRQARARSAGRSDRPDAREPGAAPRHRTLTPGDPPPLPDSGYVTANEVAAHFGVSVKAVYRWMATGRIRAERRPGGSYRIPADQFH